MSEIDSLGTNYYYAGVQNSRNESLKNQKAKETNNKSKISFSKLLQKEQEVQPEFETIGLPPEIQSMSFDDAIVFLQDQVDNTGNLLNQELTQENLIRFKISVSNFIRFVVDNNFQVTSKRSRRTVIVSPVNFFSTFNTKAHVQDPKIQIQIINEKLDMLTQEMLERQEDNLKLLETVGEIKGLIVDLMSS